jgi:putative copper export protein
MIPQRILPLTAIIALVPDWLTAASYFVHLIATVIWVGGIAMLSLVVYPSLKKILGDQPLKGALISEIYRRFSPLAMISLAALIVTGLSQMAVNPNYNGLLKIDNAWAWAILIKHIVFAVMTLLGIYSIWGLAPAIGRLALLESKGKLTTTELTALRQREERLNTLNLICAIAILALTAIARSV